MVDPFGRRDRWCGYNALQCWELELPSTTVIAGQTVELLQNIERDFFLGIDQRHHFEL